MSAINTHVLLILLALLLCSVATWRSILFKKKADRQAKLLNETNQTLAEVQKKLIVLQEKDSTRLKSPPDCKNPVCPRTTTTVTCLLRKDIDMYILLPPMVCRRMR